MLGMRGAFLCRVGEHGHLNSANFRLQKRSSQCCDGFVCMKIIKNKETIVTFRLVMNSDWQAGHEFYRVCHCA